MSWPKIFKSRANARREKRKEQGQIFAEEMKRGTTSLFTSLESVVYCVHYNQTREFI
jgi:hypothetical protein